MNASLNRAAALGRLGVAMMLHDKPKLCGTLLGVVFAVILVNQQGGTFLGILAKNRMLIDHANADLWIVPRGARQLQTTRTLGDSALRQARGAPGVGWAEPLLLGPAAISLPAGGSELVTLVGTRLPRLAGGPWNLVAGGTGSLSEPDTIVVEDSQREKLGGLDLGSVRELEGRRVRVGALTWGLVPFEPPYAFAELELGRSALRLPRDRQTFVLVGLAPGADPDAVRAELRRRLPEADVHTAAGLAEVVTDFLLASTPLGVTFGSATALGLIVGVVVVSLSMLSAVLDNLREFGTLKAIGATTADLAVLLVAQSVAYALAGSLLGLAAVTQVARGIRSAQLVVHLPGWLVGATVLVMIAVCVGSSTLALLRLRKLEPGAVFR